MIDVTNQGLLLRSPYNPFFVAEFKTAIPNRERKYNPDDRTWLVDPKYGKVLLAMVYKYWPLSRLTLAEEAAICTPKTSTITKSTLDVFYVGRLKLRSDGTESASGWWNDGWNIIFPKAVLAAWFKTTNMMPNTQQDYFSLLGVTRTSNPDELKKAWRRMAMQWHPDHCKEPLAEETFKRIKMAYDTLKDTNLRARYIAGLALEDKLKASYKQPKRDRKFLDRVSSEPKSDPRFEWSPPLRCGRITAQGEFSVGRFIVATILTWDDIVNATGQTMVSSWATGEETFTMKWV